MKKGINQMIRLRRARNLTQQDVADSTGLKRSTIAALESGANDKPSVGTAMVLGQYFDFDWKLFFEEEDERDTLYGNGS